MQLTGKTAVVTGSARGLGLAIARKLASLGANVVLNGSSDAVYDAEKELKEEGFTVLAVKGDVRKTEDADRMIETAVKTFGSVDILVNNAGITKDTLLIRMSDEEWDDVLDTNLKGAFLCIRSASRYMIKQRSGRIVNITSVVGVVGNKGQANYSASKAGLIGLTKSAAKELASRGITVNAVAPGFIVSRMTDKLPEKVKEAYLSSIPLARFGTPEEVANLTAFLVSDDAAYITGQVIHIDGGLAM